MATIRVPVDLQTPRFTSLAGNALWNPTNLSTADVDYGFWDFVKDVEGKIYGQVAVPSSLDASPAAKIILIIAANATTGDTQLQVSTLPVANTESLDQSLTAITAQTITVQSTAFQIKEVIFTLAGQPSADDQLVVEVFHDGNHASDTLAVSTLLLAAYLQIVI